MPGTGRSEMSKACGRDIISSWCWAAREPWNGGANLGFSLQLSCSSFMEQTHFLKLRYKGHNIILVSGAQHSDSVICL